MRGAGVVAVVGTSATELSLLVYKRQPLPTRLDPKKSRTSLNPTVQSRNENALGQPLSQDPGQKYRPAASQPPACSQCRYSCVACFLCNRSHLRPLLKSVGVSHRLFPGTKGIRSGYERVLGYVDL